MNIVDETRRGHEIRLGELYIGDFFVYENRLHLVIDTGEDDTAIIFDCEKHDNYMLKQKISVVKANVQLTVTGYE